MDSEYCIVFVTCANESQAQAIASAVLENRHAACVNIVPGVRSLYWWNGAVQDDSELLCIMKTRTDRFEALRDAVAQVHAYDVPEIIAMPISAGHQPYLNWINDSVR